GTWKLNVAKSKFSPGAELTAGIRLYTEANGTFTLEQKLTGKDGKERSNRVQYRDGEDIKQALTAGADTTHAKKVDANTWDFDLSHAVSPLRWPVGSLLALRSWHQYRA